MRNPSTPRRALALALALAACLTAAAPTPALAHHSMWHSGEDFDDPNGGSGSTSLTDDGVDPVLAGVIGASVGVPLWLYAIGMGIYLNSEGERQLAGGVALSDRDAVVAAGVINVALGALTTIASTTVLLTTEDVTQDVAAVALGLSALQLGVGVWGVTFSGRAPDASAARPPTIAPMISVGRQGEPLVGAAFSMSF